MLTDLGVLLPSIVVCAAFCAGVWYIVRGELAPKRRDREDGQASHAIPPEDTILPEDGEAPGASEHEGTGERSSGSTSRSQAG